MGWPRALRELKDLLYEVYLAAGAPSLDEITADVAGDDGLAGAPSRDNVRRCISAPSLPPSQADVGAVATVLARRAAWDHQDLTGRVRELWVAARMAVGVGRPVGEFNEDDRLVLVDLEVHPALDVEGAHDRVGALPVYVPRAHDTRLEAVVTAAEAGRSGIAVLVGGSSTGKTRAMWEAVRELPDPWRVWHPLSPSRPDAALAHLADIAPHTVVWLNEAQYYVGPDPLGEQVAAGLRELLNDPSRAPVLILATLWPEHWDTLVTRTGRDRHAQARALLAGHEIDVPDAFTRADLAAVAGIDDADPRLARAAERAQDAQVTQYLAGVPALTARYDTTRGATRALIHAAMDARRLGAGPHLPLAWLADAAPGYLTDTEYNTLDADWLSHALGYVTTPCNGLPGILIPVRPGAGRNQRPSAASRTAAGPPDRRAQGPLYLLADYLDQYGRRHRAEDIPPVAFWTAAASHAHPADLDTLGDAAWARGLYRDAAQLHKHATAHGDPHAPYTLVRHLHALDPTDSRPARWAATHIPLGDPYAVARLLNLLRTVGTREQVDALLARDPAVHTAPEAPFAVAQLLESLWKAGASQEVEALAERAVARVDLDAPEDLARLLETLWEAGAREQAAALAERAATHAPLGNPFAVAQLLERLRKAGMQEQVDALLARDPAAHIALDNPDAVIWLLKCLREAAAAEQLAAVAERAATHAALDDPYVLGRLLEGLREVGARGQAAALAARAATHATLDDPFAVARLLGRLREAGEREQVEALLARDPAAHVALDDPDAVAWLLDRLWEAGSWEQVEALLARDPVTHVALGDLYAVVRLLKRLWQVGAQEQAGVLAERAAAHAGLDDPYAVARLLECLREAGGQAQAAALAERAAAHVALDDPYEVARLLDILREAGAGEQVDALLARGPAVHVAFDNPSAVAWLLDLFRRVGATEQVDALLARDPAVHAALDEPGGVARLLEVLQEAGAQEQAAALAERVVADAVLDEPGAVTWLLKSLLEVGAQEQAAALAARAATHALDNPYEVAGLLDFLLEVGAREHAAALAERAASHVAVDQPDAVGRLLERLREAGAREQAATLLERLPATGHFARYVSHQENPERFRHGREPSGDAAPRWSWSDLE
ncbi:hypothetical protein [Streptomyces olindensis]|uniref:hypothetical protein n=1 Tax=Streptomyces olindensis TaxID=358823 RepID=UPI0033D04AED